MTREEQRQRCIANLNLAIDRARNPGACRYVDDEGPCCVIGQLAVIEGVPLDSLNEWDTMGWSGESVRFGARGREDKTANHSNLEKYCRWTLMEIQNHWDTISYGKQTETERREKMRNCVSTMPILA